MNFLFFYFLKWEDCFVDFWILRKRRHRRRIKRKEAVETFANLWKISSPLVVFVAGWPSHCFFSVLSLYFPFFSSSLLLFIIFSYFTFCSPSIFLVLSAVNFYASFEISRLWSIISDGKWKILIFMFTFHPSIGHVASCVVFFFSLTRCKLQIIILLQFILNSKKSTIVYM